MNNKHWFNHVTPISQFLSFYEGLNWGFIGGLNIRENLIQQELLSYLSTSIESVKAKPKLWFTF